MHSAALAASWRFWPVASQGPLSALGAPGGVPASLEVVEVDVWPPRVLVVATGLNPGHTVTVYRSVAGVRSIVRGGDAITTTDVSLVLVDAEEPFGVLITYVLNVDGVDVDSALITVQLPDGDVVAASDAVTGNAAAIRVIAWPDRLRSRQSSTFQVGGRNLVVAGPRGGFSGSLDVYTDTTANAESFEDLITNATSATIQLRAPASLEPGKSYDRFDCYVSVLSDTEHRWSQDGTDPQRTWTLEVVEVDPWDASLATRGFTYQDVTDAYVGLTYVDLANDYASYLLMDQGDFS